MNNVLVQAYCRVFINLCIMQEVFACQRRGYTLITWNTWPEHVNRSCSESYEMFMNLKHLNMKKTCSHEGNMFTWSKYVHMNVHMKQICSHEGNMIVHMKQICSHEANMFTWREYVHMKGIICSHEANMFTWSKCVNMKEICSHEANNYVEMKQMCSHQGNISR